MKPRTNTVTKEKFRHKSLTNFIAAKNGFYSLLRSIKTARVTEWWHSNMLEGSFCAFVPLRPYGLAILDGIEKKTPPSSTNADATREMH
jgi:hypothetical protein